MTSFTDLTVLVTGDVPGLSRDAAKNAVIALGGRAVSAVSGKVDLVIAGEGAGVSKMDKARIHGCRIITGDQFASLIEGVVSGYDLLPGMTQPEWVAHLEALQAGEESEPEERTPRPGDPDYIPLEDRHLVGLASDSTRIGKVTHKRYRLSCSCGHKWTAAPTPGRIPDCPVEGGDLTSPVLLGPWEMPGGGWPDDLDEQADSSGDPDLPADSESADSDRIDSESADEEIGSQGDEPVADGSGLAAVETTTPPVADALLTNFPEAEPSRVGDEDAFDALMAIETAYRAAGQHEIPGCLDEPAYF